MPKSSKGGAFERTVAKQLSLWWSDGEADDWFWRTAGSGGRATNRAKQGKATVNSEGDICAQTGEAQKLLNLVVFELKRGYNATSVSDLLDNSGGEMAKFIEQAKKSASLAGTPYWAVIHKRDRRDAIVVTNWTLLAAWARPRALHVQRGSDCDGIFVCRLDSCLDAYTRTAIKKCLEKAQNASGS